MRAVISWAVALLVCTASFGQTAGSSSEHRDFFEKEIRPLLVRNCYQCHSSRAATVFGEFRLDSREALLEGGRVRSCRRAG